MLLKVHEENPSPRQIQKIVECLENNGIIIYPTDTFYGIGCSLYKPRAVERIAFIKGIPLQQANFSILCTNLSDLSTYAKYVDTSIYKIMKKCLPGPYTFILHASSQVPKLFMSKKKTIGIRVPNNNIVHAIITELGHPLVSTSIEINPNNIDESIHPELIYEKYKNLVDIVIDGGIGGIEGSTVIDCTEDTIKVVRVGKGPIDFLDIEQTT